MCVIKHRELYMQCCTTLHALARSGLRDNGGGEVIDTGMAQYLNVYHCVRELTCMCI